MILKINFKNKKIYIISKTISIKKKKKTP